MLSGGIGKRKSGELVHHISMKHCIRQVFFGVLKTLFEILLILIPAAFGIAGRSLLVFAVFLAVVCVLRTISRKDRAIFRIATGVYLLLAVFSMDGLSILWPFLYNSSGWYFGIYVLSIPAATLVFYKHPIFGLTWWHGLLIASHLVLAGMSAILELSSPDQECRNIDHHPYVEALMVYEFQETVTPRYIVVMPDESMVYVANRTQNPRSELGLFAIEMTSGHVTGVSLGQEVPAHIAYDSTTDQLLVVTYHELDGIRALRKREVPQNAKLIRVDAGRVVTDQTVALDSAGDLYSFVVPQKDRISIVYHGRHYKVDRATDIMTRHEMPDDGMAHAITDLMLINGRWVFAYGGSFIQFLMTPAVFETKDPEYSADTIKHTAFGYMVLGYDAISDRILAISSFSNVIDVLDRSLEKQTEIHFDDVVRRVATDPVRRIGYAGQYLSGNLIAFDLDSYQELGRIKIGKNIRAIVPLQDGRVVAGSKCGIFMIHPEAVSSADSPLLPE